MTIGVIRSAVLAAGVLALAGCEMLNPVTPSPVPPPRPERPAPVVKRAEPSAESRELAVYFKRIETGLLAQGLLRSDGGGPDVPFSARNLAENFERIALYEEYATIGGQIVAQQTESQVHRWHVPVRFGVEFGETVPDAQRAKDSASIKKFSDRLARVANWPISVVQSNPNFHILIVNEDERRGLEPRLRQFIPAISDVAVRTVTDMPKTTYCLVFAWDPADNGAYTRAVAVIRGEHPDLMRLSCIHEELVQGLGLSNDSPAARPSIFNDDEEFGLLTSHDELLLKMLYDPRIEAGMPADEAREIANEIAAELLGGPS